MTKKPLEKQLGFGVVPALLILVGIVAAGLVGWRVYDANQQKQSNPSALPTNTSQIDQVQGPKTESRQPGDDKVSSLDGAVSFMLPSGWEAPNVVTGAGKCGYQGADPQVMGICDTSGNLRPKTYTGEPRWHFQIFKTTTPPKVWAEIPLGLPSNPSFESVNENKVNGYPAYYVKARGGGYISAHYFIADKGYLVYLNARHGADIDDSQYMSDFETIIHSIKIQ
jgi:hypothetical protein